MACWPTTGGRHHGICSCLATHPPITPRRPHPINLSKPKRPRMSNEQFFLAVGLLIFLIATPLLIALLVRVLIRDTPEAAGAEESQGDVITNFDSLGDFWSGIAPHLIELRNRLTKGLLAVLAGTIIGFWIVNSSWLLGDTLPNLL